MKHEILARGEKFDQNIPREIERKFLPLFPERLDEFRHESKLIEQYYLSHPDEPFSLRLRETIERDGSISYEATLKDRGQIAHGGLDRLEVTTPVTEALYHYYRDEVTTPLIRKLRAEPLPGIAIDFMADGHIRVESEDDANWQRFILTHGDYFVETTGDRASDNEWCAHLGFRREHQGREAHLPQPDLSVDDIVRDIMLRDRARPLRVHIAGRSGSGKSTIVRKLQQALATQHLDSVVLSTDEYHRGSRWLTAHNDGQPWPHWDDPIVYDTRSMADDLARLGEGQPIPHRTIDWTIAEPVIDGDLSPASVIIIEGIYATSPDIVASSSLVYAMTTPLATCIGRRLLRDLQERPQFADPAESLSYMLREAEPSYRRQQGVLR